MFQTEGTMIWCRLGFGSPPLLSHCGCAGAEQLFGVIRRAQLPRCSAGFGQEQAGSMNAGFRVRPRSWPGSRMTAALLEKDRAGEKGRPMFQSCRVSVFTMSGSEVRPSSCVRELFSGRLGIKIFLFFLEAFVARDRQWKILPFSSYGHRD